MKRFFALALVLILAFGLAACHSHGAQSFTVEAGRAAFVQRAEPSALGTVACRTTLPDGYYFEADWGDSGILAYRVLDPDFGTTRYGVLRGGDTVLPFQYTAIERVGDFLVGRYRAEDVVSIEVYDATGHLLVGTDDTSAGVRAVGDDYFVLYTDSKAQMFDGEGKAFFHDGVLLPTDAVSQCGDYFLTAHKGNAYTIWDGPNVLRRRFEAADTRYLVAYVGERFLVTALTAGTADSHTYVEVTDEGTQYFVQQAWWYDPVTDALTPLSLDYVLLAVRNPYTPGLSAAAIESLSLQAGYSAFVVAELNTYGVHTADRYYVADANAALWVRYPTGINADAIYYRSDLGCVGSAADGGTALLYDLAGNLVWQNSEHAYATMRWQSGRFVASYHRDGVTRYGAFDSAGKVAVPFQYDYLSPYVDGRAVARVGSQYYTVDATGRQLGTVSIACPEHWLGFGLYTYIQGGKVGVKNLTGAVVEPAQWDAIDGVGINDEGRTYVVGTSGTTQTLLVLQ